MKTQCALYLLFSWLAVKTMKGLEGVIDLFCCGPVPWIFIPTGSYKIIQTTTWGFLRNPVHNFWQCWTSAVCRCFKRGASDLRLFCNVLASVRCMPCLEAETDFLLWKVKFNDWAFGGKFEHHFWPALTQTSKKGSLSVVSLTLLPYCFTGTFSTLYFSGRLIRYFCRDWLCKYLKSHKWPLCGISPVATSYNSTSAMMSRLAIGHALTVLCPSCFSRPERISAARVSGSNQ